MAGLLELAQLIGRVPHARVELVAFTLEEPPHFGSDRMGSAVHAAALKAAGARVRAMLSLEMIGYFDDAPGSQRFPSALLRLVYPERGDFIAVVGRLSDAALTRRIKRAMQSGSTLDVRSVSGPEGMDAIGLSDHARYWAHGFPAVMITDTAFFRNPHYHRLRDTPDTLDYARMAQVVEQVYRAVMALAD